MASWSTGTGTGIFPSRHIHTCVPPTPRHRHSTPSLPCCCWPGVRGQRSVKFHTLSLCIWAPKWQLAAGKSGGKSRSYIGVQGSGKLQAITNAPTCKWLAGSDFGSGFCPGTGSGSLVLGSPLASRAVFAIMKPKGKAHRARELRALRNVANWQGLVWRGVLRKQIS